MVSGDMDAVAAGNTEAAAAPAQDIPTGSDTDAQADFSEHALTESSDGSLTSGRLDEIWGQTPEVNAFSDQADYSKFYLFSRDYQLTPREQHILQLLLDNKTNVEIADDLCISIGTAKAHVHNIFSKVEVKKRQQLLDVYKNYKTTDTP